MTHDAVRSGVSIHAPAKGSDITGITMRSRPTCRFNPRPREGGDTQLRRHILGACTSFNPRPREEGDSVSVLPTSWRLRLKFQSTPPRRGRHELVIGHHVSLIAVSIHAPAKGRRTGDRRPRRRGRWFQSTPPRRGRRLARYPGMPRYRFNPRPREGGDTAQCRPQQASFNPRPRRGDAVPSLTQVP